jgi:hypothetical protein
MLLGTNEQRRHADDQDHDDRERVHTPQPAGARKDHREPPCGEGVDACMADHETSSGRVMPTPVLGSGLPRLERTFQPALEFA